MPYEHKRIVTVTFEVSATTSADADHLAEYVADDLQDHDDFLVECIADAQQSDDREERDNVPVAMFTFSACQRWCHSE